MWQRLTRHVRRVVVLSADSVRHPNLYLIISKTSAVMRGYALRRCERRSVCSCSSIITNEPPLFVLYYDCAFEPLATYSRTDCGVVIFLRFEGRPGSVTITYTLTFTESV